MVTRLRGLFVLLLFTPLAFAADAPGDLAAQVRATEIAFASPLATPVSTRWAPSVALTIVARTRSVLPVAWLIASRMPASVLCAESMPTWNVLVPMLMVSVPVPTVCPAPPSNSFDLICAVVAS